MKLAQAFLIATVLIACGESPLTPGKKTTIKKKDENYTYEYNENGCKTGKKSFSSHDDYCKGLMNDADNNYCARTMRQDAYDQNCR